MKKLLVLMVVLAFASLASAVIVSPMEIKDNGDGTYGIDLISGMSDTVDYSGGYWALVGVDYATGHLTNPAILDASQLYDSSTQVGLGEGALGGFVTYTMNAWSSTAGVYADGYTALEGATALYLWQLDDGYGQIGIVDTLIIPEPATITLLCLGGLLLRKKK